MRNICVIEECDRYVNAQGLCGKHYYRMRKHGDPLICMPYRDGGKAKYATMEERFWASIVKKSDDECWEWNGAVDNYGYGIMSKKINGKPVTFRAHRFSYELHNKECIKDFIICHKCDNPPCSNPNHLFLGTLADNNRDRNLKGRTVSSPGSRHVKSKLTEYKVIQILTSLKKGETCKSLGKKYGVSSALISQVKRGIIWKHVLRDF